MSNSQFSNTINRFSCHFSSAKKGVLKTMLVSKNYPFPPCSFIHERTPDYSSFLPAVGS